MTMGNGVAAVVVTYNRKTLLCRCLEAVLGQRGVACDVLVIDNASTDGTGQMVQEHFGSCDRVSYLSTGRNLGGAGGFQTGVREALRRGYDRLWLMDDDTIPGPSALAELVRAGAGREDWGFLVSAAYWTDGSVCRMNIPKRTIFRHVGEEAYRGGPTPVVMCSFVSLFLRAEAVKEVGLPIGEYFVWTDDYEFTGRLSARYPCYMVPASKVTHAMRRHTRVDFATDDADRLERYKYLYRNDVHCYRRYGLRGWAYILLKDLYTAGNILLRSQGNRGEKLRVLYRGFASGLRFSPEIEKWPPDAVRLTGGEDMPPGPQLKKLHEQFLVLLKAFHALCVENGIKYSLHGGTLLGAVREKGFIPWDDDMDVSLTREEYRRLCGVFRALPEGGALSLRMIDRLPRVVLAEEGKPLVWIDLFIFDPISGRLLPQKCKILGTMFLSGFKKSREVFSITQIKYRDRKGKDALRYALYRAAYLMGRPFPQDMKYRLFDWFCQNCFCGRRDHIHLSNDQYGGVTLVVPKEYMDSFLTVPFEDTELMILRDHGKLLPLMYGGGYMTPVKYPEREFAAHEIVRGILTRMVYGGL